MNRRYFSLVLAMLLGVALVLAPLTSFAGSSEDEQVQIMRTPPCPGHEYITQPTNAIRYHWRNETFHTEDAEFIQICKNCGSQGGYAYVTLEDELRHHIEYRWVDYHPYGDKYHHFYHPCSVCQGRVGKEVKSLCPGDDYGHITHP